MKPNNENSISKAVQQDVNRLQTNYELLKKDFKYQSETIEKMDGKFDKLIEKVDNLQYVPYTVYRDAIESWKKQFDGVTKRVLDLETYQEDNKTGVKFINNVTSNILSTAALGLAAVAIFYVAFKFASKGGA